MCTYMHFPSSDIRGIDVFPLDGEEVIFAADVPFVAHHIIRSRNCATLRLMAWSVLPPCHVGLGYAVQ